MMLDPNESRRPGFELWMRENYSFCMGDVLERHEEFDADDLLVKTGEYLHEEVSSNWACWNGAVDAAQGPIKKVLA